MAQLIADRNDIDFVLYEQFNVEELTGQEKFKAFNRKTFDLVINEARSLAIKENLPTFTEGDQAGVRLEDGQVRVPSCYHRAFKLLRKGGWTSMTADLDHGGQGFPVCIAQAANEYLVGANSAFAFYANVGRANTVPLLQNLATQLEAAVNQLKKTAVNLGALAFSPKVKVAFAFAKPFLDAIGDICMAWMHLWRVCVAAPRLEDLVGSLDPEARRKKATTSRKAAFYERVLQTTKYYINSVLPITTGKMNAITAGDSAIVDIPEASFGG